MTEHDERILAMLENEDESAEEQQDPEEQARRELEEHPEILEAAVERKMRKLTPSGFIVLIIGVIVIALGLFIHSNENTTLGGFLSGVGAIALIIAVCILLIGLI